MPKTARGNSLEREEEQVLETTNISNLQVPFYNSSMIKMNKLSLSQINPSL